jgi:hypothetical protein
MLRELSARARPASADPTHRRRPAIRRVNVSLLPRCLAFHTLVTARSVSRVARRTISVSRAIAASTRAAVPRATGLPVRTQASARVTSAPSGSAAPRLAPERASHALSAPRAEPAPTFPLTWPIHPVLASIRARPLVAPMAGATATVGARSIRKGRRAWAGAVRAGAKPSRHHPPVTASATVSRPPRSPAPRSSAAPPRAGTHVHRILTVSHQRVATAAALARLPRKGCSRSDAPRADASTIGPACRL